MDYLDHAYSFPGVRGSNFVSGRLGFGTSIDKPPMLGLFKLHGHPISRVISNDASTGR
jgi:hypothetical protein